jgi:hypothetical protein
LERSTIKTSVYRRNAGVSKTYSYVAWWTRVPFECRVTSGSDISEGKKLLRAENGVNNPLEIKFKPTNGLEISSLEKRLRSLKFGSRWREAQTRQDTE